MKRITILFVIMLMCGSVFGTMVQDSILVVEYTNVAPVIDGELDDVWRNITAIPTEKMVDNDAYWDAYFGWTDVYVTMRLMYDDENLYLFYDILDDVLGLDGTTNQHEWDGMEIYFDGDYSRGERDASVGDGLGFDQIDDVQVRFNFIDDVNDWVFPGIGWGSPWTSWDGGAVADDEVREGAEYAWLEKDHYPGAHLEVKYPLESLRLYPMGGELFGYDIQYNDNDGDPDQVREGEWKWWHDGDNSWNSPQVWGSAMWGSNFVAEEYLNVPKATEIPTIDGEMEAAWDGLPVFSASQWVWVDSNNGDKEAPNMVSVGGMDWVNNVEEFMWDWNDCRGEFKMMWSEDAIYLFVMVYDDFIEIESGASYQKDGLEIYFDGDNSKNDWTFDEAYDDNDIQLRTVFESETFEQLAESPVAFVPTDYGYAMEAEILFSELGWEPELGLDFGFELQINDNDGEETYLRENMMRWYSHDNNSWQDASLFGNAIFGPTIDEMGVGVEDEMPQHVVMEYNLAQNYPNPFNPSTNIEFSLPSTSNIHLTVYDMLGKQVATLVNGVKPAGTHVVTFDGADLSSGVYFYKLETDSEVFMNKMMLVK